MPSIEPIRFRVRISRTGEAAKLTHLGQIEALRRAVAASGLPAAIDGRGKRPRLAFGPAISLGYESQAEYFDMELTQALAPGHLSERLGAALPSGFAVKTLRRIPPFYPSLDSSLNVARYRIGGPFPAQAAESLKTFLERPSIVIRKIKEGGARFEEVDARPLIREMTLETADSLALTLRFGPKRTVKPEAVLKAWLGDCRLEDFRVMREDLLSETAQGQLLTP